MECSICLSTNARNVIPLQPGHELHNTVCDTCKIRWTAENRANECPYCKGLWLSTLAYDSLIGWRHFYHYVYNFFSRDNLISIAHFTLLFLGAHVIVDYIFSLIFTQWVSFSNYPRMSDIYAEIDDGIQEQMGKLNKLIDLMNQYVNHVLTNRYGISQQCPNMYYVTY